ncbi:MAG: mechanosensitive ion channel [Ruminococcaceae bacterium]|nr:mechanosensitive ion channel [Oscillospiraceae bacterium]
MKLLNADLITASDTVSEAFEEAVNTITDFPESTAEIGDYLSGIFDIIAEYAITYGGRLLAALALLLIGFRIIKILNKKLAKAKVFDKIESSTKNFMFKVLDVAAKVLLVILAASILGVPMASVVAVIGSAGLAIGLALEGSLGNIASGVVLMVTKPFKEGDFITVGGADGGVVNDIGIFYTSITTPDNRRIVYPNSTIAGATLVNVTAEKDRRVDLVFTTSYNADVQTVKNCIAAVIEKHELVKKDPEPFVRLSKHADSALEFTVRVWTDAADYWTVYFDLLEQVKAGFDAKGIEIPYPQMDVHIKENKN